MLGTTEAKRRRGQQRMRWLGITESMHVNLSKLGPQAHQLYIHIVMVFLVFHYFKDFSQDAFLSIDVFRKLQSLNVICLIPEICHLK